jgi:uncharacterized membrane protein
MKMNDIVTRHSTVLGFLSWLVPFAVSFLFVDRTGQFMIPQPLFKSVMVVLFGGLGTALLAFAFSRIPPTARSGFMLGMYWLVMNLVLDLVVLVPLVHMPVVTYFSDIGLRYLLIPIIATAIGLVAQRARQQVPSS